MSEGKVSSFALRIYKSLFTLRGFVNLHVRIANIFCLLLNKSLIFFFLPLLAVLAIGAMSFTLIGGGKHKTMKENKKFTTVGFTYGGPNTSTGRQTPSNYTTADPATLCPSGTTIFCGIVFDDVQYPLVGGLPSSTFLTNEVNVHFNDSPGSHSFTVNGVTYYRKDS